LEAQARAEHAAAQSLATSRRNLTAGAVSELELLTAERTYNQAEVALTQARAARLADTVALFQALGGGWWNRDQSEMAATTSGAVK
jgi:outer membrane protein TolC